MNKRVETGAIWALVSSRTSTGHRAREEYRKLRAALAEHKGEFATYAVGERVEKHTGDYQLTGEVRAVFTTKAGKVRYVVEHDPGFLHIYGDANLRPALAHKEQAE